MFTTLDGKEYYVSFTISKIKKLKDYGIDITKENGIFEIADDLITLGDVLWILCEEQCKDKKIEQQEFFDSFDGDVLEKASKEVLQAYINFCPAPRRELLKKTMARLEKVSDQVLDKVAKNLEEITDEKIMEAIEKEMSI